MASLIQGYEYDIFISYRQKDNKGDKWVSTFVEGLKTELEATFKEDISIYFDENPHDRLQETHDVARSLEGKLKCLIFIPVLSQTYCDPASYAWQYEFLAFNKSAREDRFGMEIRLRNGNYTSRILPVRIHDLERDDIELFEHETGGPLRSIDFVFRTSSGVNRPLQSDEDRPNENLSRTLYRDQLNKVANSIKEIMLSLKKIESSNEQGKENLPQDDKRQLKQVKMQGEKIRSMRWLMIPVSLLIVLVISFAILSSINRRRVAGDSSLVDKSIAVLPFANESPDKEENEYFSNQVMVDILNQLQKIGTLTLKPDSTVKKYRNSDKGIKAIGRELGVSLIVLGKVWKVEDSLRIFISLNDTGTGDKLWSEKYEGDYSKRFFEFGSRVARKVAESLKAVITAQEREKIDKIPTSNMQAYDLNSRGNEMISKFQFTRDTLDLLRAISSFNKALTLDPDYIDPIAGKGLAFTEFRKNDSALAIFDKLEQLDMTRIESASGKGLIYQYSHQTDSAFKYYNKALEMEPDNFWFNLAMGQIYFLDKNDIRNGLRYYQKAYQSGGEEQPQINFHIAILYFHTGYYLKALQYLKKAIYLSQECTLYNRYSYILSVQGKHKEALQYLDSTCSISSCDQWCNMMRSHIYTEIKEFKRAEEYYNLAIKEGYKQNDDDDLFMAYLLKETGRKKESLSLLASFINRKETLSDTSSIEYLRLAAAFAIAGENQKAIKYLIHYNSNFELLGILLSPESFSGFDSLRADPEFKAFLKQRSDERSNQLSEVLDMEKRGEINF